MDSTTGGGTVAAPTTEDDATNEFLSSLSKASEGPVASLASSSTADAPAPEILEFSVKDPTSKDWSALCEAMTARVTNTPLSPLLSRLLANENSLWDVRTWLEIMRGVENLDINEARLFYAFFLYQFPTSGGMWKQYAEAEFKAQNLDAVQDLLTQSLLVIRCPDVELWMFYLSFLKVTKFDPVVESLGPSAPELKKVRSAIAEAYELAIERVGVALSASEIWIGYIRFLKTDPDPQAFVSVRKVFHRAVTVPLFNMDAIWKEYENFEKSIPNNDALMQNFIKIYRPKFDAARAIARDRKVHFDTVNPNLLATPVNTSSTSKPMDEQLKGWIAFLKFECSNPEMLDPVNLKSRVRFTFETCLSTKRFHPEIWYQYAVYEKTSGDAEAASQIFLRGIEAMGSGGSTKESKPTSELLTFGYADHLELRNDISGAREVYEKLLRSCPSALAYINYQRFARRASGLDEARSIFKRARKDQRPGACDHQVFAAAALLEYYTNGTASNKQVALNIFELGYKKYMTSVDYAISYIDFISKLNDDNNTRSLFEKVLTTIPPKDSRPIWDRFLEFEHTLAANGGDLKVVAKLEERKAAALPDLLEIEKTGLLSVSHRYAFKNLLPNTRDDASFFSLYGRVNTSGDGDASSNLALYYSDTVADTAGKTKKRIPGPILPDCILELAELLPLGETWKGPIADPEMMFNTLVNAALPPRTEVEGHEDEILKKLQEKKLRVRRTGLAGGNNSGGMNGDSDDENGGRSVLSKRPAHDVFRSRQQQKMAKIL